MQAAQNAPEQLSLWPDASLRDETLARIGRRARPERRLLGLLAAAARHADHALASAVLAEVFSWPEEHRAQCTRKARLLYDMTALLARAGHTELALRMAPSIPFAPGMAQVLVLSVGEPPQRFCWRVTPAYALTHGRRVAALPVAELALPFQRGEVEIDQQYLERVLLPRRHRPPPILLLPHPLGQVELGGVPYVILDGNHRVVCAWRQRRLWVPAYILTEAEGGAVLVSHSRWPPYTTVRSTTVSQTVR
jgi:hypothetical protein